MYCLFLIALLIFQVRAHVPVFDDNLREKDVTDKSWGVYVHLEKGESFRVYLDVKQGDNISFSVNMAGSQAFEEGIQYVNVSLSGHNASDIDCDEDFTGWEVRRLSEEHHTGLIDSTKHLHVETHDKPLVFEPFGVGYYRSLAACQGPVPVADKFWVDIQALEDVSLSIGAGMAEQFTAEEIIMMPITILRTWIWDNYIIYWLIASLLFIALYFIEVTCAYKYGFKLYDYLEVNVLIFGISINIFHYVIRFIHIHMPMYSTSEKDQETVFVGVLLHIVAPLIVLITAVVCFLYCGSWNKKCTLKFIGRFLLLCYSLLLWQGYYILGVYYAALVFATLSGIDIQLCNFICTCCRKDNKLKYSEVEITDVKL